MAVFLCYNFWGLLFGGAYFQNFTVPPVSNHPKCEDLVVAYVRWSHMRIKPQGSYPSRGPDKSPFFNRIYYTQFFK